MKSSELTKKRCVTGNILHQIRDAGALCKDGPLRGGDTMRRIPYVSVKGEKRYEHINKSQ